MEEKRLTLPLTAEQAKSLRAGEQLLLSGEMLVARDAAHQRFFEALEEGKELPVSLKGETVYYMGPSPARPGQVIGSCGPTTATRMDRYTPRLLEEGLRVMIGKGRRSEEVIRAIEKHGAVYLAAVGGCGALLARSVVSSRAAAYEDLGPEAVLRLLVRDFPCIVAVDSAGGNLYKREK